EDEAVERLRLAQVLDLGACAVEDRARRADGGAHRALPGRRPVVAEVALRHELAVRVDLRHAERAREGAVPAADAALRHRGEDDPLRVDLDRVRRADARARRVGAVHADGRRGLDGLGAGQEVQVDHRVAAVPGTLAARLLAGAAADAAIRVDVERLDHATRSMRTAATLNSGILATGS